jgi:small subunit ribosomal protein S1
LPPEDEFSLTLFDIAFSLNQVFKKNKFIDKQKTWLYNKNTKNEVNYVVNPAKKDLIKTAKKKRQSQTQKELDFKKFLKTSDANAAQITPGKEVEGRLISKASHRLLIDLSPWGTGVIYAAELRQTPTNLKTLKPGDAVRAKVLVRENEEGLIELSLKEIGAREAWDQLERAFQQGQAIPVEVVGANKGGLIVETEGLSGFLPASQLGIENYPRVEDGDSNKILEKLKSLEGSQIKAKIIGLERAAQKIIFSEKAAEEKTLKQKLAKYKIGDVVSGKVTGVVDFGAFVEFDENLEGLVHISELDWKLIENPHEVVKTGDKVKVKIIDVSGTQVSLSMKALKPNPWEKAEEKYQVGKIYHGKVSKLNPFGAFVYLDNDIHGLVHISQFGSPKKMQQKLSLGKTFQFKITSMKPEEHRMSLQLVPNKQIEASQ